MFMFEAGNVFRVSPFPSRVFSHLHEAELARLSLSVRMKPAFPPDNRFHQGGFDVIAKRRRPDGNILAALEATCLPPIEQASADNEQNQNQQRPPSLHGPGFTRA